MAFTVYNTNNINNRLNGYQNGAVCLCLLIHTKATNLALSCLSVCHKGACQGSSLRGGKACNITPLSLVWQITYLSEIPYILYLPLLLKQLRLGDLLWVLREHLLAVHIHIIPQIQCSIQNFAVSPIRFHFQHAIVLNCAKHMLLLQYVPPSCSRIVSHFTASKDLSSQRQILVTTHNTAGTICQKKFLMALLFLEWEVFQLNFNIYLNIYSCDLIKDCSHNLRMTASNLLFISLLQKGLWPSIPPCTHKGTIFLIQTGCANGAIDR